jgi:hypothetical protein
MQFKVPQFLDIEDKIFGPLTFSQFVYLVGGAGLCYVIFKLLGLLFGIIPILIIAGIALALTFYRPNNKPLVNMVESALKYSMQSKLYVWKRKKFKKSVATANKEKMEAMDENNLRLSGGKLRDLSWSLDVLDLKKENNN